MEKALRTGSSAAARDSTTARRAGTCPEEGGGGAAMSRNPSNIMSLTHASESLRARNGLGE